MKKKKDDKITFWSFIKSDILCVILLPIKVYSKINKINYLRIYNELNEDGLWVPVIMVTWGILAFLSFIPAIILNLPAKEGLPLILVLPIVFIYFGARFIWFKAFQEMEQQEVIDHNLEYKFDDDLTEDFYNTVSGSGG